MEGAHRNVGAPRVYRWRAAVPLLCMEGLGKSDFGVERLAAPGSGVARFRQELL